MNFPGNNELRLNMATLRELVEDHLNEGRVSKPKIRVTDIKAGTGYTYADTLEVKFTTDPDPDKPAPVAPALAVVHDARGPG